jgi:prepilin-type N-terminal cleavage/methylation domain-containing protein
MTNFTRTSPNTPRGFTLVETLVAIALLMIAISAPFYSVQQAIMASNAARDQLIASSLAEEGAEYIYFMRDSNYLSNVSWLTGMDNCVPPPNGSSPYGCTVDPSQNQIAPCASNGCAPLKSSSANFYTYSGNGLATRFVRTVKVTPQPNGYQAKVTVTVTWVSEHRNYSVNVEENLYNWL